MRYLDPEAQRSHNTPANYTSHRPDARPRGRHGGAGNVGRFGDRRDGTSRADGERWERGALTDRTRDRDHFARGSSDRYDGRVGRSADRRHGGARDRDDRGDHGDRWVSGPDARRPVFNASRNLDDDLDRYRSKGEDERRQDGYAADQWRHDAGINGGGRERAGVEQAERADRAKGWNERFAPAQGDTAEHGEAGAGGASGHEERGERGAAASLLGRLGEVGASAEQAEDEEEDMIIED